MSVVVLRRILLVVVGGCLGGDVAAAGPARPETDLMGQLSSESVDVRREAARRLEPERIGQLAPDLAVRAALVAARDADARIRETALGGLGLLAAVVADRVALPAAPAIADALRASPDLRPTLERIVREDADADVVLAASVPLMMAFGTDPAAEAVVLDRVDELASPVDQVRLMDSVASGGIDGEETFQRLARKLDEGPPIVQHKAALLLLTAKSLPADGLDDFLRILETPETFADPLLVGALPRFGVPPEAYLPRLLVLQARLEEELQRPREQRTLAIHNDAHWRQTLQEAIAAARTGPS